MTTNTSGRCRRVLAPGIAILSLVASAVPAHTGGPRPDSHAPIGVMGDHTHDAGEWMISYRYMTMDMEDNLRGENSVSPGQIVTTLANPYAPPPTARVVPLSMTTDMHMFGLMYAPSDSVTLTGMVGYLDKTMDHLTFMGMAGTDRLGTFTADSSGLGDTKVTALWNLHKADGASLHLNLGLSLPTGSIDEQGQVLTPMNTRPTLRLPYAMQLGSGTYDFEPGVTYARLGEKVGWGVQYRATLRSGENDEGYTLGDIHQLIGWSSYRFSSAVSGSLRLSWHSEDRIDGRDPMIGAPVQTANPDNYGGERLDLGIGINIATASHHRFAIEYQSPIQQDVNGVQLQMQSMLTLGYQHDW